jgi:hypothetical protein
MLKVFPDKGFRVLDRNEYKYHKKIMRYSEDLDLILQSELAELINMKRAEVGPFSKEFVDNYYQKFIQKCKKSKYFTDVKSLFFCKNLKKDIVFLIKKAYNTMYARCKEK